VKKNEEDSEISNFENFGAVGFIRFQQQNEDMKTYYAEGQGQQNISPQKKRHGL
jgi:hypothetical protein